MSNLEAYALTIEAVMEGLSLSRAEVYRRVKDGKLKSEKIDHQLHFAEEEVERYAGVLTEERDALQEMTHHWLAGYEERLGKHEYMDLKEVSETPVTEQIAELGRRIIIDSLLSEVEDLYLDPVHDGDRLLYSAVEHRTELARFKTALATPLKAWFKSLVTFPVTEPPGIQEALGQQTYLDSPGQYRMTVVPTLLGEHIHIHFFSHVKDVGIETLGYTLIQLEALRSLLKGRPGLVLITGAVDPFAEQHRLALAHELSIEGRLVISLEHQVQYRLDTLVQLDIGEKNGIGFGALWQAALDMRPDVIFFDDCRTKEEAQALIEGVNSGAVVIAKIRAANAIDALTRLIQFEVHRPNIAQVLLGVVERLVLRQMIAEDLSRRPITPEEALILQVSEDTPIPTPSDDPVISDAHARRVIFGIWPTDEGLRTWICTPDAPPPHQIEKPDQNLSLAQALRQAVLDGEVSSDDAMPFLGVRFGAQDHLEDH